MKILVLNCGSSSIKFQLWDMQQHTCNACGIAEKVGLKGSFVKLEKPNGDKVRFEGEIIDHQTGIEYILGILTSTKHGSLASLDDLDAVGHRVAHGGEHFKGSAFIDQFALDEIEKCSELAPLHNPANLKGIKAMMQLIPGIRQVAVFDTAFHQTMPEHAYMYAIPYSLYNKYRIRRYGFHGTSHWYISKEACRLLNVPIGKQKIITCHLGNGASMCAIEGGKSIDTSMGFTPVEGLIMGTRTGDLDIGVVNFIMDKEELGLSSLNTVFNKQSGMLGITGVSSDMREIEYAAYTEKNERALLGLKMYFYRIKKYIGSYAAALGGLDILIFSGGIGENGPGTRAAICEKLEFLGIKIDPSKNDNLRGKEMLISTGDSRVKVVVMPTNEELVIAEDTLQIVSALNETVIKN
ncbi:MAG TPA: acetate kinase [Marinilabiliales bacterium]|nr:MAG: acetate kinase [Bacteroidetes bacterium GWA2_40_14]OFX57719.1 MAG: acetate kinase [Bacteroidetes bacterium GWC2_40_13]OFX71350.1 MAG: acetate kinase [Bacteroidetes bacterium GWD2_40_43]OFX91455.1 MAG: acetate kinase [Bacteroidetes bacterium GWE2_40_63]OFY19525.1 MAG: acetate kinase [Bacteroidetes bacterium GWF2_40_13]OFZ32210.1 MAG: acetate kinase [Bacteroidetes bacterium RIFOXYC2_FULL_40_12]HAM97671.1 acetate kinase [Marinilabiliales bacterium]